MAVTTVYLGGDDFNAVPNWTNGVPVLAADIAIFDHRASSAPTVNLTQGGASEFKLRVTPDYRFGLGLSGQPLSWKSGDIHIRGSGKYHIDCMNASAPTIVIDGPNDRMECTLTTPGASPDDVLVKCGHLIVGPTANLTGDTVLVDGVQAKVTILAEAAAEVGPSRLIVNQGVCDNQRDSIAGGWVRVGAQGRLNYTANLDNASVVEIYEGGRMLYYPTLPQVVKSPDVYVYGTLDLSQNEIAAIVGGTFIVGKSGMVIPSPLEIGGVDTTYDLRDEWP